MLNLNFEMIFIWFLFSSAQINGNFEGFLVNAMKTFFNVKLFFKD